MFCEHCEGRITNALKGVSGVESAEASFQKGEAIAVFDPERTNVSELHRAIIDAGYEAAENTSYAHIISILIILLSMYVIAKRLGWLNIFKQFPVIENTMEYGMLFLIGFMTSIHCIAMCGGINLAQATASSKKNGKNLVSNMLYNIGRIVSYTLTGAVCGAIGQTAGLSGTWKGILPIAIGILMLVMALNMLGVFKAIRIIKLPKGLYRWAAGKAGSGSAFIIGLLNGLMPCGPLQSMQMYALGTGSAVRGALSMLLFRTAISCWAFGTSKTRSIIMSKSIFLKLLFM